jgi:hypothetical protein
VSQNEAVLLKTAIAHNIGKNLWHGFRSGNNVYTNFLIYFSHLNKIIMKNRFTPNDDPGRDLWAKNFASKLAIYATKYGITPAEVTDVQQGSAYFTYILNLNKQFEEFKHKFTQFKTDMRDNISAVGSTAPVVPTLGTPPPAVAPGILVRMNSIALRIKKHVAYLEADGLDLGIEGTASPAPDLVSIRPVISVRLINNGHPEIVWKKKGMSSIALYVDRGEGFKPLAIDSFPNYIDTETLPAGETAIWKYKGIYIYKDAKVGTFSDEVKITVTGQDE